MSFIKAAWISVCLFFCIMGSAVAGTCAFVSGIQIVSGNSQTALINAAFTSPLIVRVTGYAPITGDPTNCQGLTVVFTPPGSGASATLSTPAVTDANGETSVTATANGTAGTYSVHVTQNLTGNSVNFSLTNATSQAATPTFSPAAGTYSSAQTVTLSSTTSGAVIYYTTDGSTPTSASTQYMSPITVSTSETVKAIALATGYADSNVASGAYVIGGSPGPGGITITSSEESATVEPGYPTRIDFTVTTPVELHGVGVNFLNLTYPIPDGVTATESDNTCDGTLSANSSCSFQVDMTSAVGAKATTFALAPQLTADGDAVKVIPDADNRPTITVNMTTISMNATSALFSFSNSSTSGSIGTGQSVISITNTGNMAAANLTARTPGGISLSGNTCGSSLAVGETCQMTFTTSGTPNPTQNISILGDNVDAVTLPIAPLSVRVYSAPVNPVPGNASLMVVKTCTVPEQLLLTNNSSSTVSGISVSKDSGLSDVSVTDAMVNCSSGTLSAGSSCVVGITAPSSSGSSNTQGNIFINWATSQIGAVLTGVEATGAGLPPIGTPAAATIAYGGYVYQENATCNLVKVAALADQYTGPGATLETAFSEDLKNHLTTPPNDAQGQINTTALVAQAGANAGSTASGLCATYSEASGGTTYAGWYLPWDDGGAPGSTTSELPAMWTYLSQGNSYNGFNNQKDYWSSSVISSTLAYALNFQTGESFGKQRSDTLVYVRCSRALTY